MSQAGEFNALCGSLLCACLRLSSSKEEPTLPTSIKPSTRLMLCQMLHGDPNKRLGLGYFLGNWVFNESNPRVAKTALATAFDICKEAKSGSLHSFRQDVEAAAPAIFGERDMSVSAAISARRL